MTINCPTAETLPALKLLWQQAFGDPESFVDAFFQKGFSFDRCRCLFENRQLAAALYWFDCTCENQKLAYIYGVATDANFRRRGLCHRLMEDTLQYLANLGYAGAILVPAGEPLRRFYAHMGFRSFGGIREFTSVQSAASISIRKIGPEEYAALRAKLLPKGSVLQEGKTLFFLNSYTEFYAGENVFFTLYRDGDRAFCAELLGNDAAAGAILNALGLSQGRFRTPGKESFAMCYPLTENFRTPSYFGLALD